MLEYLRNAADKPVAKFLIGILAFSFVGWGVAEWIFGNVMGNNTVMTVGNADISAQQLNTEKSRQMAAMSREQQRAIYTDAAASGAFLQQVMATIATQQMAENRAHDLGFVVSDNRIAREIREFPDFQSDGRFSTRMFDYILTNSGYTEAQFADVLRGQILRAMTLGSMSVPVNVPQFAVDAAYNTRYARRKIEYVPVKFSEFKTERPTEQQLRDFYAQNPHVIPETRAVSYVLIPAQMDKPDSYDAGYATARRVEDDIIAGESMSDAASRHKAKYVQIKAFARDARPSDAILNDALIAKAFDMDEATESEMIETKHGFVMIRVDRVTPAHNADFESVKRTLNGDWTRAAQEKQAYVRANELLVDLNKNGKLDGKKQTATVSRTSGAPTGVLVAAFSNPVGTNTIVPADDAFYVLAVRDEILPQPDAKKSAELRRELQNMGTRIIQDDYNSFLKREYPIKVNEKVFNRFFAR